VARSSGEPFDWTTWPPPEFRPVRPDPWRDLPGGFVTDWAVPQGRFELPLPGSMRQYDCTAVNPNYKATILGYAS
jgi:hypothetical protein